MPRRSRSPHEAGLLRLPGPLQSGGAAIAAGIRTSAHRGRGVLRARAPRTAGGTSRGRDVDFEDPRDLARQNPLSVPQRPQDREAVLAGKEEDRLPERLLVHGTEPSAEPLREVRSLGIVEL